MLALFSGKTYVRIANAWDVTDLPGTGSTGDRRYTAHWDFNPAIIAALDPTPNADFLDVSRVDWFYYDVRYVCENGLMNGTSRNRFSPYGTVTRRPCPITRCPRGSVLLFCQIPVQHGCELGAGGEAGGVELAVCALQDARAAGPAHGGQRVIGHGLRVTVP